MGNSESGPLESSLGFFVQKLSKNSIRLHTAFLYHDWSSLFFLISNQIEDKKKKKWDATESISSNDNCNDSTQQALIGRKMSQRFFLLPIIDEESIKSDWTKNNFLNPGGSRNFRVGLQLDALVRWFSGRQECIGTWGLVPTNFVR